MRKQFDDAVKAVIMEGYRNGISYFLESVNESLEELYLLDEDNLNDKIELLMLEADLESNESDVKDQNVNQKDKKQDEVDDDLENIDLEVLDAEIKKIMKELDED